MNTAIRIGQAERTGTTGTTDTTGKTGMRVIDMGTETRTGIEVKIGGMEMIEEEGMVGIEIGVGAGVGAQRGLVDMTSEVSLIPFAFLDDTMLTRAEKSRGYDRDRPRDDRSSKRDEIDVKPSRRDLDSPRSSARGGSIPVEPPVSKPVAPSAPSGPSRPEAVPSGPRGGYNGPVPVPGRGGFGGRGGYGGGGGGGHGRQGGYGNQGGGDYDRPLDRRAIEEGRRRREEERARARAEELRREGGFLSAFSPMSLVG